MAISMIEEFIGARGASSINHKRDGTYYQRERNTEEKGFRFQEIHERYHFQSQQREQQLYLPHLIPFSLGKSNCITSSKNMIC